MFDRPGIRSASKSGQKRQPLNRDDEGQGSNEERLLTAKVDGPTNREDYLQDTEQIATLYLVRARPIIAEMARFWDLLNNGTIETQEPDGREIISSMRRAVMNGGRVEWHETCYCSPPLRHERATVYDQFFGDMEIRSLVSTAPPEGESFWHYLEDRNTEKGNGHKDGPVNMTRYVPVRIF
jgi:hypothetical protein